ncbi:MAG: hypothetical protein Q7S02_01095, partial [bacterium]|nr:hypothetical protein [bacterium]
SGDAGIIIYEDTAKRLEVGYLSAGVYGLKVYATNGTTVIWESSDTQQIAGGWSFTDTAFYNLASGTPTAAPNDGTVILANATPAVIVYEDTAERARMGYLSAGVFGFRAYATDGTTAIFEASDTQQMLGGWNFTNLVLRTGATDAASNVLIDSANSLLRLGPTTGASITMDGANQRLRSSTYVSGVSGFNVDPTLIEAQNILARGTMSGTVFRYDVSSATGGRQIIANADALSTAMTALDASTLTIRGNITLAVNDILIIRAQTALGIQEEYLRVTAIGSAPTYSVTRDLAGTFAADTNPIWTAGTVVIQQGVSDGGAVFSGGWLELVGEASSGVDWPRISVYQRTGVAYNASTERVRVGNLNGYLGYAADTFGVGMGSSVAGEANITIDPTNGLRMRQGTTDLITLDNAGTASLLNLTVAGSLNVLTSGNIRSGQTAYHTGTGFFLEYNAGTPRLSIGNPATNYLTWDGTNLTVSGGLVMNAGTGVVTINQSATTGSSLSVIRNLASASTDSAVVYFQNDHAGDDQVVLSMVQDAPVEAFTLVQNTAASSFGITTAGTNSIAFSMVANSLTTGGIAQFLSNSADVSARNLVSIVNDNTLATGARCLNIQQDSIFEAVRITAASTTSDVMVLVTSSLTTNIALNIPNCDALTTGSIARFVSNSADAGSRNLVSIVNDNTLATGATVLSLQQDAAIRAFYIDVNADIQAMYVDASTTTNNIIEVRGASLTGGVGIHFPDLDALTTGSGARI